MPAFRNKPDISTPQQSRTFPSRDTQKCLETYCHDGQSATGIQQIQARNPMTLSTIPRTTSRDVLWNQMSTLSTMRKSTTNKQKINTSIAGTESHDETKQQNIAKGKNKKGKPFNKDRKGYKRAETLPSQDALECDMPTASCDVTHNNICC